jgi:hypothetical protein
MKAYIRLTLLATLLLCMSAACKTKQGNGGGAIPSDFSLQIEHTGCRGNCPNYKMWVDAKGNANYYGHHAVDMMGNYNKTLEQATMKAMYQAIVDAKFLDFDDVYGGGVADIPAVITTVTMHDKTKRVEDIRFAPKELKELEAKLEALFGINGWKKEG